MKKALKIVGILILVIILGASLFVYQAVSPLPAEAERIIAAAVESPSVPLQGKEGYAYNGETKIWYEVIEPQAVDSIKGSLLLIMGISNDALGWPQYFLDPLVEAGYRVIRYDNRATGLSDWGEDWDEANSYTLTDMAADGIAVLDQLNVEKAHIIGVSLGGMIAQETALAFPERVISLTSMLSSANMADDSLPGINMDIIQELILAQIRYGLLPGEANQVRLMISVRQSLQGDKDYPIDLEGTAQAVLYNLRERNGMNNQAFKQQSAAVMSSGSREEALQELQIRTLIVHGTADPLIPFAHGQKCAQLIPGAKHLWVEGMGHDIPAAVSPQILTAIFAHLQEP
ncbi:MAG: alpha/beta fold hydrolase [Bacteroidia bacterium]